MTRTDIHRPSAIIPEDYVYVGQEYARMDDIGECLLIQSERERIARHMASTGGTYSRHAHGGNCHVCGNANALYTCLFYHAKSNTYVRMGSDCADKCMMAIDSGEANAFHTAVRNALALSAGKRHAEAVLNEAGLATAWSIYCAPYSYTERREEATIRDITGKLVRYGDLSEKQAEFLHSLVDAIARRHEVDKQRQAEHDAAAPAPSGRVEFSGTVLSVKPVETAYGTCIKMLVATVAGWKAYGSCPTNTEVHRGDTVRVRATVKPSPDDVKFAFFSRPKLVA